MIREAIESDLDAISRLARAVHQNMVENNIRQWSDHYPLREHFEKDLERQALFVFTENQTVLASISILPENDPFYKELVWTEGSSLVVHRLMVDPLQMKKGLGSLMMDFARLKAIAEGYDSLKVDTHPDNYRMQQLILKCGYKEIGYMKGMNRIGYELVL